ncbi:uncharacterized protein LOC110435314 [Sorghum bicolor]|uniref:uncharacterized protein LOC110435314 n=1 Tax=Sorghum bicolor TaxID=4558 RepID=UPI00081AEA56|nr:uncharacterized protein LOC110435314 [Sorghum bicolor]|eukprot:XP_021316433.1 uncharacterized protein LOC110435314 [Sorghum bicolor]
MFPSVSFISQSPRIHFFFNDNVIFLGPARARGTEVATRTDGGSARPRVLARRARSPRRWPPEGTHRGLFGVGGLGLAGVEARAAGGPPARDLAPAGDRQRPALRARGWLGRDQRWNPVHPTAGSFWGVGLGLGCGVGWGPGFGHEVIGYVGAGCGVGFSVGFTLAGVGIGLPQHGLIRNHEHGGGCLGCIIKSATRAKGDMGLQWQRQGCCLCFVQCYSF